MVGLLIRAGLLASLGVVAGFLFNTIRPDGVSLGSAPPAAACQLTTVSARTVERLTPTAANHLCGNPNVLIADARSAESFAKGHVAGAVHLPCAAPQGVAQGVPDLLSGHSTVVVYGETTGEALAVAEGLVRRNGSNTVLRVAVLEGGFSAWELAGFACASGPCAECADGKPGELIWPGPSTTGTTRGKP